MHFHVTAFPVRFSNFTNVVVGDLSVGSDGLVVDETDAAQIFNTCYDGHSNACQKASGYYKHLRHAVMLAQRWLRVAGDRGGEKCFVYSFNLCVEVTKDGRVAVIRR